MVPNWRVLIAFPTTGRWESTFGMSLLQLVHKTAMLRPDIGFSVHQLTTSMLFSARYTLVKQAIAEGYTHILFIDTDQSFPPSLMVKLLERDRSVVACNIATKAEPSQETAIRSREALPDGRILVKGCDEKAGMEKVWRVGTGIMMIKTKVFNDIPKPWFPATWDPVHEIFTGEDWGFCELCEKAGIPIWIDHDMSAKVGHWGPKEFTLDRYKEFQRDTTEIIYQGAGSLAPQPAVGAADCPVS